MITVIRLVFAVSTVVYTYVGMTAQDFVLRKYATGVERDVVYGTAVGFAGMEGAYQGAPDS